ncbi:MAG: NAD(+)/NADH kinase, partial [Acidimicrobiales bacterium]
MTDHSMTVGIIANPVSGRDIRRVAARGGISSAEDKRNRIARAVIGAVAGGATHIVAMKEPFGIASGALADLPVEAELEILDIGARVDPADTTRAALAMRDRGINVVITLGGDGTNRTIARVWPDVTLVPMSTGTNNVFPSLVEPTVAGAAAGLVATGKTDENEVAPKSKLIHLAMPDGSEDVALIDAATLANDFVGNRMPVDP